MAEVFNGDREARQICARDQSRVARWTRPPPEVPSRICSAPATP